MKTYLIPTTAQITVALNQHLLDSSTDADLPGSGVAPEGTDFD